MANLLPIFAFMGAGFVLTGITGFVVGFKKAKLFPGAAIGFGIGVGLGLGLNVIVGLFSALLGWLLYVMLLTFLGK